MIDNQKEILARVELTKRYRDNMLKELGHISGIKAYPSQGNFILIRMKDPKGVCDGLLRKGYLVRLFSQVVLKSHMRVTVGNEEENDGFIKALKEVMLNEES